MKTTHLVAGSFLGSWPIKDFFLSSRRSTNSFCSGVNSFFFLTTGFFGFAAAFFFLAGAFAVFLAFVVAAFAFALGAAFAFVAGFADFAAVRPVVLLAVAVAKPRTARKLRRTRTPREGSNLAGRPRARGRSAWVAADRIVADSILGGWCAATLVIFCGCSCGVD